MKDFLVALALVVLALGVEAAVGLTQSLTTNVRANCLLPVLRGNTPPAQGVLQRLHVQGVLQRLQKLLSYLSYLSYLSFHCFHCLNSCLNHLLQCLQKLLSLLTPLMNVALALELFSCLHAWHGASHSLYHHRRNHNHP